MARDMIDMYLKEAKRRNRSYSFIDDEAEKQKELIGLIDHLMCETESDIVRSYCCVAMAEAERMNLQVALDMFQRAERVLIDD